MMKGMDDMSLKNFIADLDLSGENAKPSANARKPITFQVSPEIRDRYERLQQRSNRQFGKKARALLLALIEAAEGRI